MPDIVVPGALGLSIRPVGSPTRSGSVPSVGLYDVSVAPPSCSSIVAATPACAVQIWQWRSTIASRSSVRLLRGSTVSEQGGYESTQLPTAWVFIEVGDHPAVGYRIREGEEGVR